MAKWRTKAYDRLSRSRLPVYFSLVVLLVVLMLILPIYWIYSDRLKNQITRINESLIEQVQSTYDGLLQEVDRTSVRLAENINVNRFIFLEKNGLFDSEEERQLFLKELYGVIASEQKFYANIGNIYLYIPLTGVIVTSDAVMPLSSFLDRDYVAREAAGRTSSSWSEVRTSKARLVSGYPTEEQVVTLHRSLTNDGLTSDAILFIDVRMNLFKQSGSFRSSYPLALLVAGESGRLIYAESGGLDDGGKLVEAYSNGSLNESQYLYSVAQSGYNSWIYTVIVPKQWLFAPMQFISRMTFVLAVVVLMFGLLVSLYFSRRFHRPLEAALAQWRGRSGGAPDPKVASDSLQESIRSLVRSTISYANLIDANRGTIRNAVLMDLLRNNEWPAEMPIGLAARRGARFYQAIACVRDETAELNERDKGLVQYAVHNLARETFAASGADARCGMEVVTIDDNSFGMLLFGLPGEGDELSEREAHEWLCLLQEQLRPYPQFAWSFGIGRRYADDERISQSYRESQLAVQYRIYRGKGSIIPFDELQIDDSRLTASSDDWQKHKDKIISAIRSRDAEAARHSVLQWCEWMERLPRGRRNQIEWSRIYYTGYSVFTEIEKLIYDLNMDRAAIYLDDLSFVALMESNPTIVEIRQLLIKTCERMIACLDAQPSAAKSSYVAAIADYLRTEYRDPQMSLESTAERFGMNPSYLGQLLKKEMNRTFLQFLSEVRIERAKQLLADPNVQIQDVAACVGYGNRSTFIRIFKAQVGSTPSDYRNRTLLGAKGEHTTHG
ncbi:helix-turn-helix domain-containing protein [Cohnella fermenti]|uniref:AraC family transcriptional regulator n=1 Tax=Cohnella fermenti TaxID=2565925 RepID=A0A4V3WEG8_9BACL|nr:helix-turn-helix domain-containing protein [Cohnella fermenti]THF76265.1 AraC family transcriptional regulator [Cohnella fermenti]